MTEDPKLDDQTIKHLEFIQAVIARLAGNSFLLKGWALTLAAALYAFSFSTSSIRLAWVSLVPVVVFWGLDAYFLWREQHFRALYNAVRTGHPRIEPFAMAYTQFGVQCRYRSVFVSWTLAPFYGALLLSALVLTVAPQVHFHV